MQAITIYDHGRAGFRVAAGNHKPHKGSASATVRVYQASELTDAASAALACETRADVRAQIQRIAPSASPAVVRDAELSRVDLPSAKADDETDAMRRLTAAIGEAPEQLIECSTCGQHFNERAFHSTAHSEFCANPSEV